MNKEVGMGSLSLSTLPPSLISHTVSVDVKHHDRKKTRKKKKEKKKRKKARIEPHKRRAVSRRNCDTS